MSEDVVVIAAGLTAGQWQCILDAQYLDPRAYGRAGYEVRGRSAISLTAKGLAKSREIHSYTGRRRPGVVLTERGVAVREYIGTPSDMPKGDG